MCVTKGGCFYDWDLSQITCCFEKVVVSGLCAHIEVPISLLPRVLVRVVLPTAGAVDVAQQWQSRTVSSPAFGHKTVQGGNTVRTYVDKLGAPSFDGSGNRGFLQ